MSDCAKDDTSRHAKPALARYLCTKCGFVFKKNKDVCQSKKIKTDKLLKKLIEKS